MMTWLPIVVMVVAQAASWLVSIAGLIWRDRARANSNRTQISGWATTTRPGLRTHLMFPAVKGTHRGEGRPDPGPPARAHAAQQRTGMACFAGSAPLYM